MIFDVYDCLVWQYMKVLVHPKSKFVFVFPVSKLSSCDYDLDMVMSLTSSYSCVHDEGAAPQKNNYHHLVLKLVNIWMPMT